MDMRQFRDVEWRQTEDDFLVSGDPDPVEVYDTKLFDRFVAAFAVALEGPYLMTYPSAERAAEIAFDVVKNLEDEEDEALAAGLDNLFAAANSCNKPFEANPNKMTTVVATCGDDRRFPHSYWVIEGDGSLVLGASSDADGDVIETLAHYAPGAWQYLYDEGK